MNRWLGYLLLASAFIGGCAGVNRYPDYARSHPVVIEGQVVSVQDAGERPLMQKRTSGSGTVHPYSRVGVAVAYIDQNRSGLPIAAMDTISAYCLVSATGYSARMDKTYTVSPVFAEQLVVGRTGVFGLDVFEGSWVILGVEEQGALRSGEYKLRD